MTNLDSILKVLVAKLCLTLCDPWTASHRTPLSMRFSRQGYWSGLPFPSPGYLPNSGIDPKSPALQADSLPGSPCSFSGGFPGGFPGGSEVTVSACNAGDLGSVPGSGRSPGEGNGSPLQYSCLQNPMDRGACWVTVHGVAKSWTQLSKHIKKQRHHFATKGPSSQSFGFSSTHVCM